MTHLEGLDPEDREEAAWRLAEEFDHRARESESRPDPNLVTALAATRSHDVVLALLERLRDVCSGDDLAAAGRYAEHVLALAPLLAGDGPRMVRAGVDVFMADVHVRVGDATEASRRIDRCAADLTELLPGLLSDREHVLAWLAVAEGRTSSAHQHAGLARDGFAADGRWEDSALAAQTAALTHSTVTTQAVDDWRRAAELWTSADRPEDARRCVEELGRLWVRALAERATADDPARTEVYEAVRALTRDYGLPLLAARLGLAETVLLVDADVGWVKILARHRRCREEMTALDLDPVVRGGQVALVDLSLGRAALGLGLTAEGESALSAALPGLRAARLDDETRMCEGMLRLLGTAQRRDVSPSPAVDDPAIDPDLRSGLLLADGVWFAGQGRLDEALERVTAAGRVPGATADPVRELVVDAVTAAVRGMRGDREAPAAVLGRVEDRLLSADPLPTPHRLVLTRAANLLRQSVEHPAPPVRPPLDDAELDEAIAAVLRGPSGVPRRAARAAELVETLIGDPAGDPKRLRPLLALLTIADGAVPETPRWRRTRTAAQLLALMRAVAEHELADPDAAVPQIDALAAAAADDPTLTPLVRMARGVVEVAQLVHHGDTAALTRLPAELRDPVIAAELSGDARTATLQASMLAALNVLSTNARDGDMGAAIAELQEVAQTLSHGQVRDLFDDAGTVMSLFFPGGQGGTRISDVQLTELQERTIQPGLDTPESALAHTAVAAAALRGGEETDLTRVDLAVEHLNYALAIAGPEGPNRVFHLVSLALGLTRRAELTNDTTGLREATQHLAEARDRAGGPAHPLWQLISEMQADVERLLGHTPDSHRTALDGLRSHVWRVLAQPDLAGATLAVRRAGTDAVDVARRCLVAHDPEAALAALDEGRGLALLAATALDTLAERLDDADDPDLALRWRSAVASGDPARLPPDLRRAVLRAVTARGTGGDLLNSPTLTDIQHALATTDADALIYLVPGDGIVPGFAVCAPVQGAPRYLTLPHLQVDGVPELDRYRVALRRRDAAIRDTARDLGGPGTPAAPTEPDLAGSLDELGAWAWTVAMGPLIDTLVPSLPSPPPDRPPRVVLAPMGDLARVPWQAARRPQDGRYAIELIAISQAVSARMLHRSARLAPVPLTSGGLVVGDPDTGATAPALPAARREALALRQAFYRGARYIGRRPDDTVSPSGSGTGEQVRAWLTASVPSAGSMLHLACHAIVDTHSDPPAAYLLLAGGERLDAAEVTALMATAPEREIGLVVLAACQSGVAMTGYDEAYSLGSAFLAAGARSVLCTQWSILDDATSVLMFIFHRFLRTSGRPVWAALRDAQLWMLDADRVVPSDMPRLLHERLEPAGLGHPEAWAAFTHWGQ